MKEKIKKIIYDHWLIALPTILPLIGLGVLILWDYFQELMLSPVPFFIIFVALIIIGVFFLYIVNLRKEINKTKKPEVYLADDNLLYKKGDKQAYCPECFEKNNQLKRMKKVENHEGGYLHIYYKCFVCHYEDHAEEVNIKDIPF